MWHRWQPLNQVETSKLIKDRICSSHPHAIRPSFSGYRKTIFKLQTGFHNCDYEELVWERCKNNEHDEGEWRWIPYVRSCQSVKAYLQVSFLWKMFSHLCYWLIISNKPLLCNCLDCITCSFSVYNFCSIYYTVKPSFYFYCFLM